MSSVATQGRSPAARESYRRLSITQKLVALIVLTTGLLVAFLAIYFPDQQIRASRAALERKAASYGHLVSRQVASAIAFDDRETAREVFDSVAQDPDIESLTLFTARGARLHQRGTPGSWIEAAKRGVREQRVVEVGDRLAVVAPVISLEGPRGTLVVELSMRPLAEANARITRTGALVGSAALALGALAAYLIARSLGRRIGSIARVASAVTAGDLDQAPVAPEGSDEIALLAEAFNSMLARIRSLVQQMRESAAQEQERLESLVRERTRELDARNASLKLVLDNVGQGFLNVDLTGRMDEQRSAIVDEWFGLPLPGELLFDYLERTFPGQLAQFRLAWEALGEDWLPLDLRIDQLPKQLTAGGRYFGFGYKPIMSGGAPESMLVVVSDITALVQQRLAEEGEQELVLGIRWLLSDRSAFEAFLAECNDLVAAACASNEDRAGRMRLIHTLKGNAAIFGFASVARVCHELETLMSERGEDLSALDQQRLQAHWARLEERIHPFVSGRSTHTLDVSRKDYERALRELKARARHSQISSLLSRWELEPVEARFRRLADYAEGLADRLGKGPIRVHIESNDVRLDAAEWVGFWQAVVHVVRNAIDHGLETADERVRLGKPREALLVLRSRMGDGMLHMEIRDAGRGIDWERIASAARAAGLPAETRRDLERALFADAVSTAESVTTTSGRGVGLSAVRQMCDQTGGRLSVDSTPGAGTCFTFSWSIDELGHRRNFDLPRPPMLGTAG